MEQQPPTTLATIRDIEARGEDVRIFSLMPQAPLRYHAGQYIRLALPGFESRPFSVASAPQASGLMRLHVRNSGAGLSRALFACQPGDTVALSGPYGRMAAHRGADRPVLMVAGGTGIAPMLAIAHDMLKNGHTEHGMELVYGARTEDDIYCRAELEALCSSGELSVHYALGHNTPDSVLATMNKNLYEHAIFVCGPAPMVGVVHAALAAKGAHPERIYCDTPPKDMP